MQTIGFKFEHYNLFPVWKAEHWMGKEVSFNLKGQKLVGQVIEASREYLGNGIHDILTVEIWDGNSQLKIQAHRQKFKLEEE